MKTVAVVGTSLSGWRAAQELRDQGFDGHLILIGEEPHPPYDRPPLSKDFLTRALDPEELRLGTPTEESALQAQWRLGERAVRINPRAGTITLSSGGEVRADGVVIATGSSPNALEGPANLPGRHVLRTLDDALALRGDVHPGTRVVVVGAGFRGAEVASACRARGAQVTLAEALHMPLVRTLGVEIAPVCAALHEDHGVRTRYGTRAVRVLGEDRVTGVELADGRVLHTDVVVLTIGTRPATGWLRGSGVPVRDGVLTDAGGMTRIPAVVAVGDVARAHNPRLGRTARLDHSANAEEKSPIAVTNLLAGRTVRQHHGMAHFWSEQYGYRIQFAGHAGPRDKITVVTGSPDYRKFVATYHRSGRLVAVFAMNSPKQFAHYRRRLATTGPGSWTYSAMASSSRSAR